MITHSVLLLLPPRVQAYLAAIAQICADSNHAIVSAVLFGSAATGSFCESASDVDIIFVLQDTADPEDRRRLRNVITSMEVFYGLRDVMSHSGVLGAFVEKVAMSDRSFFICGRGDLLSGDASRILNISSTQTHFVDGIVIPSILSSAKTIWGEDLLADIPVKSIRRRDVLIALFGSFSNVMASAVLFPVLPNATRYAMAALKHSMHSCYFCYHAKRAGLEEEANYFQKYIGPSRAMDQLMTLRKAYTPSFGFVARCIPTLLRLHLRTVLDNRFPREIGAISC